MDWQTIETAPRDGTWILIWSLEDGVSFAHWSNTPAGFEDHMGWHSEETGPGYSYEYENPTHWMPLPPAPTNHS